VRRFLPHLLNTVKFSSAPAGVTTLNACDYLSREFSSRRQFFDIFLGSLPDALNIAAPGQSKILLAVA
ncbi:hypothetical protein ACVBGD_09075, partial [Klebsiella pneumoniae]